MTDNGRTDADPRRHFADLISLFLHRIYLIIKNLRSIVTPQALREIMKTSLFRSSVITINLTTVIKSSTFPYYTKNDLQAQEKARYELAFFSERNSNNCTAATTARIKNRPAVWMGTKSCPKITTPRSVATRGSAT